jgi:membrane peptidoglycan carboxypeptidase
LSDRQVAGKTGTSENNANAWFVGYTPQLATAVWMGSPIGNVPMLSVGGKSADGTYQYYRTVFGGTYPALMWHDFMQAALQGQPAIDFVKPDQNDLGTIQSVKSPGGSYTQYSGNGSTTPRSTTTLSDGGTTTVPTGGPTTTTRGGPPTTGTGGPPTSTGPPPTKPSPPTTGVP